MYKYTYELSQSYRTETSSCAENYQSVKLHKPLPQQSQPLWSNHVNPAARSPPKAFHHLNGSHYRNEMPKQSINIEKKQIKKYQPYKRLSFEPLSHATAQNNVHQNNGLQQRFKQISEKYSHKRLEPQVRERMREPKKETSLRQEVQSENMTLKTNSFEVKPKQFNIDVQKPLTQLNKPLKTYSEEEYAINRARVKSEIAVYLHKNNLNNQQATGQQPPKKYDYKINREPSEVPSNDQVESEKSSVTVAKLTSLQQRIKSTVEPFIHL